MISPNNNNLKWYLYKSITGVQNQSILLLCKPPVNIPPNVFFFCFCQSNIYQYFLSIPDMSLVPIRCLGAPVSLVYSDFLIVINRIERVLWGTIHTWKSARPHCDCRLRNIQYYYWYISKLKADLSMPWCRNIRGYVGREIQMRPNDR